MDGASVMRFGIKTSSDAFFLPDMYCQMPKLVNGNQRNADLLVVNAVVDTWFDWKRMCMCMMDSCYEETIITTLILQAETVYYG